MIVEMRFELCFAKPYSYFIESLSDDIVVLLIIVFFSECINKFNPTAIFWGHYFVVKITLANRRINASKLKIK